MLEQLFGSKTRVKLLRLFLNNPGEPYYLRQIAREIGIQLNSVRREINNLEKIGIIKSTRILPETEEKKKKIQTRRRRQEKKTKKTTKKYKKYFLANTEFVVYPELKAILLKAQLLLEKDLVKEIEKIARVRYLALTGIFVGLDGYSTDILLVGSVNRRKMGQVIKKFERNLNHSINYTVMSLKEFKYRHDITDRFLYDILEGKKVVIADKL